MAVPEAEAAAWLPMVMAVSAGGVQVAGAVVAVVPLLPADDGDQGAESGGRVRGRWRT